MQFSRDFAIILAINSKKPCFFDIIRYNYNEYRCSFRASTLRCPQWFSQDNSGQELQIGFRSAYAPLDFIQIVIEEFKECEGYYMPQVGYYQMFINKITDQQLLNSINSIKQTAEEIWTPDVRIIKDFTDHGPDHSERIFGKLKQLLWPDDAIAFLSERELYVLILSVILHDIGMQCDIKKHQKVSEIAVKRYGAVFSVPFTPGNANDYSKDEQIDVRRNHHLLTAAWLEELFLQPDPVLPTISLDTVPVDLRGDVIDVCRFHSKLNIFDCPEMSTIGHVRTRFLASLLRLGDELDIDKYRVDVNTVKLFSFDTVNSFFWYLHSYTQIYIEQHTIRLNIFLNESDYNDCGNILQQKVIIAFANKNRGLTEILRINGINVGISQLSQVCINRYQRPLPKEILDYIITLR